MARSKRLAALLLLLAGTAVAQDPVKWTVSPLAAPVRSGEVFSVDLNAQIDPAWHIYSVTQGPGGPFPTRITLPEGQAFRLHGAIVGTPPKTEMDANFGIMTESLAGNPVFHIPVTVTGAAGNQELHINVRYQACDESNCLPPRTDKLTLAVNVVEGGSALPSFIWMAMTMGALSLLTPCVFPMVPITVSYFTKHAARDRGRAVRDAVIYACGIILTFTALGLVLAAVFGAAGINKFAANPWVNLGVTAIFLAFALSLFGLFELAVPSGLLNRMDSMARGRESGKVIGLLLMGLTFTLTSFTCTAPFVGTLLVMASQGKLLDPAIGMLAFSTVFATPFFVLALAPQLVSQLPRAGGWMNSVKVVMGLLEVAAAMKFLSNADLIWHWGIFSREVVLAIWVVVGALTVCYVLGFFRLGHEAPVKRRGVARYATAAVFLAVTIALIPGLFGRRLGELDSFLPPEKSAQSAVGSVEVVDGIRWRMNDYDKARDEALRDGKLLFVDFTGYTCTNCRWMETNMFPRAEVRQELEKYVAVRLYTDGEGAVFDRQQKLQQSQFGTVALPLYAILRADGSMVATFPGLTRKSGEFLAFLKRGDVASNPQSPAAPM